MESITTHPIIKGFYYISNIFNQIVRWKKIGPSRRKK